MWFPLYSLLVTIDLRSFPSKTMWFPKILRPTHLSSPPPPQPIWKIVSVLLVKEMSAGDMNRERKSPSLSISQSAPVKKISLTWSIMTRSRKSIPHHTLLPLIFITGVHPPYPHPNSPMWQRSVVGCEPRWRETSLLTFDLLKYNWSNYISNWLSYDANLYHLYLLNFLTDKLPSSVFKIQSGFNQLTTSASPVSQKRRF